MSFEVKVSGESTSSVGRLAALWAELQRSLDPAAEINVVEISKSALVLGALFINSLEGRQDEAFKTLCRGTVIQVPASEIEGYEGTPGMTVLEPEQDGGYYNVCVDTFPGPREVAPEPVHGRLP